MLIYTLGRFLLFLANWMSVSQDVMYEEIPCYVLSSPRDPLLTIRKNSKWWWNYEQSIIGYRYLGLPFPRKGGLCRIVVRGDGLGACAHRPHGLHRVVLVEFALPDNQTIKIGHFMTAIDQGTFGGIIRSAEPQEWKEDSSLEMWLWPPLMSGAFQS